MKARGMSSSFSSSSSKHKQRRKIFFRRSSSTSLSPTTTSNHSTTPIPNHSSQRRRLSSSSNLNNSTSSTCSADRRSIFKFDSKNLSPKSLSIQESSCASSISSNDSTPHNRSKETHGKASVTKQLSLDIPQMSNSSSKNKIKFKPTLKQLPRISQNDNKGSNVLPSPSSSTSKNQPISSFADSRKTTNQNDTSQMATIKANNFTKNNTTMTEQPQQQQSISQDYDPHLPKREKFFLTESTAQEKKKAKKKPPQSHSPSPQTKSTPKSNNSVNSTLEKRLFHSLHTSQVKNPSIKEFKECWAFAKAVQTCFGKDNIEVVLDVAGGHGALGALLLLSLPTTSKSIIIDPAEVNGGVELAWGKFYKGTEKKKELTYRHECLRSGLRKELDHALDVLGISPKRILVVACHACQHLSDETLEIACSYGVHVTVMPCCQKDLSGGSFKAFGKQLSMNIGVLMDILAAGKVMSWNNGKKSRVKYQVKMKLIDDKITPQNRIILCKAKNLDDDLEQKKIKVAHEKLTRAYHKAHGNTKKGVVQVYKKVKASTCIKSLSVGMVTGVLLCYAFRKR